MSDPVSIKTSIKRETTQQTNGIPIDRSSQSSVSSVHITCDGQIIKKEVDLLGDFLFESTIEVENLNLPEESWNGCLMTENCRHKETLENTNNVTKTYNGQDVKVEIDFLGKWKFVTTIEIENQLPFSLQSTSCNKDQVQIFVCNMCHDSFTPKKRIIHHLQKLHKTNYKTTKKISRNKFSAGTNDNGISIKTRRNSCNINTKMEPVKNPHLIVSKLKEGNNKTPLFKCNLCQKTFNTKVKIIRHLKKPHNLKKQKPIVNIPETSTNINNANRNGRYECDVCSKTFLYKSQLVIHERLHTGEKPFKCNVCEKTFSQSSSLKKHERLHTGTKPYKCNVCKRTFTQLFNLECHERQHTGEKPYTCNVCKKTFTNCSTLKVHERLHTGEKPYKCNVCNKTFTQRPNLKSHERLHTGSKPYKCNVCNKTFTQTSNLKRHERQHIGAKPIYM